MIRSLDELTPQARSAAEGYLASVWATIEAGVREPVLDDLRAHLFERLSPDATAEDVAALATEAGPMTRGTSGASARWQAFLTGMRPGGAGARIAGTWWNPAEERLFLPRALGWGWDLNFGALAVRLGLIEPDAEAVPFTSTPEPAFRMAAAVPVALAGATVLHYAVRGRSLPGRLPAHWDITGRPDRWSSKPRAAAADLGATVVPALVAWWAARSARPGPDRAGTIAAATAFATVGAAVTVLRSLGERPRPWAGPAMVTAMTASVGAALYGLARAGRAAEIRRDLGQA